MAGEWNYSSSKWRGDPNDKGIQTSEDYRFYAISAEFPEFSNKDNTLVFQFSVKNEQKLDCGGGYMKLLRGEVDQKKFGIDTPYSIMFGPDICGYNTKKVHAILTYNGTNHLIRKDVPRETDQLTHVYTFVLKPDATYSILINNVEKQTDLFLLGFGFVNILTIWCWQLEDWDEEYIPNPKDKKPEGYDDIPKEIPDLDAKKMAPTIANLEYKGEWKPKVKSGTLFDNVLNTDDPYGRRFDEAEKKREEEAEDEDGDDAGEESDAESKTEATDNGDGTNKDDDKHVAVYCVQL
ncbi:hypothetical protein FNV43_RR27038 [Rhamnella rubrinervis]|uniref:Calreticulin n=1 Tax=Rhamnella rubrinervis TaxID=2594499 RepID=A0A8K0GPS2_9ROSA|nr:hypothetical protein FNV43_RR27038 [Rhamnella rubrinervis]